MSNSSNFLLLWTRTVALLFAISSVKFCPTLFYITVWQQVICTLNICKDLEPAPLEKASLCAKARMEETQKRSICQTQGQSLKLQARFSKQDQPFSWRPWILTANCLNLNHSNLLCFMVCWGAMYCNNSLHRLNYVWMFTARQRLCIICIKVANAFRNVLSSVKRAEQMENNSS